QVGNQETGFFFGVHAAEKEGNMQMALYGWIEGNSDNMTHPVGKLAPNPFGLFDIHGNVMEWCWDWQDHYPRARLLLTDLVGPNNQRIGRVKRGGCCFSPLAEARCGARMGKSPLDATNRNGFRLARNVPKK
ncbi:MAG: SUMF1/EgtB/PvdO family nonheme iron enzyme, partial [Verrucomicrobiota bacterium]